MNLSPLQGKAVDAVMDWYKNSKRQDFKLFGYAGSGKTTLARHIGDQFKYVIYVAFTGKAALVLRKKGCSPSSTIHSLIYKAHQDNETGKFHFSLDWESEATQADLIIVDEGPMVGVTLGTDLCKLARKILVLGDPAQLPPVNDESYWGQDDPDFLLTEIHRQALDNPIIALSQLVRNEGTLSLGSFGESRIIKAKNFEAGMMSEHSQTLVGKNDTRHHMNLQHRQHVGYMDATGFVPGVNEKLICLRNDKEKGFLNGSLWKVDHAYQNGQDVLCGILPEDIDDEIEAVPTDILTPIEYFQGKDAYLDWRVKKSVDEFCYSYAITTHKAQGSQWPSVLIFDQSKVFKQDARKWLYTAVTRAEERITVLI
jgi:exodeoxyribonuclease-5